MNTVTSRQRQVIVGRAHDEGWGRVESSKVVESVAGVE